MTDTVRSERFVQGAATIVPVRDMALTLALYVDVLGFETRELSDDSKFGLVVCSEVAVMVLQSDDEAAFLATLRSISIHIWFDDADDFYSALRSKLDNLPQGRVRPPFDQPYGMREFHVKGPDGCLLSLRKEIDS